MLSEAKLKMSQDIVADGLNQIMNARRAGKDELEINRHSKLLLSILAIAKLRSYVKSYKVINNVLKVELDKLNGCKAIKPNFTVTKDQIERYVTRFLPARNLGVIIISTSQGLMTHQTAQDKHLGGSLIAYLY